MHTLGRKRDYEDLLVLCLFDYCWLISGNEDPLLLHSLCQAELFVPFLYMHHVLINTMESCLCINLVCTTHLDTVKGKRESKDQVI